MKRQDFKDIVTPLEIGAKVTVKLTVTFLMPSQFNSNLHGTYQGVEGLKIKVHTLEMDYLIAFHRISSIEVH